MIPRGSCQARKNRLLTRAARKRRGGTEGAGKQPARRLPTCPTRLPSRNQSPRPGGRSRTRASAPLCSRRAKILKSSSTKTKLPTTASFRLFWTAPSGGRPAESRLQPGLAAPQFTICLVHKVNLLCDVTHPGSSSVWGLVALRWGRSARLRRLGGRGGGGCVLQKRARQGRGGEGRT